MTVGQDGAAVKNSSWGFCSREQGSRLVAGPGCTSTGNESGEWSKQGGDLVKP
jgi:hypothetical protein